MARSTSTSRARIVALSFVLAAALPAAARAQPLDPVAQEAQQQFMLGREAMKHGELGRAVNLFKRSQELHPTPGTLLNLASCEQQLGKVASALEHYQTAAKQLADDPERLRVAKQGIAEVEPRVPFLRLDRAVGAPLRMSIKLDGVAVAETSIGVEQPIDPGRYTITSSAPGREDRSVRVTLVDGQHRTFAVEAGPVIAATPATSAPVAQRGASPARLAGFALGGAGIAGLGLGAAAGILAIVKNGEFNDACPDPAKCDVDGVKANGAAQAFTTMSIAALVTGGVGLAAGVTLVVVTREKAPATVSLGPSVLPGGAGIGALGRF